MVHFSKNLFEMQSDTPLISFTFDDFPQTSLSIGAQILNNYDFKGTYYTALGLRDTTSVLGKICSTEDIKKAAADGHELGCHTYSHVDTWKEKSNEFESSLIDNQREIKEILPGYEFKSFAYPKGNCTPATKLIAEKYYACSRGGRGQTYNCRSVDLNNLKAYFLEKRLGYNINAVSEVIDNTCRERGWLIFGTHEICDDPSAYGYSTEYFEKVVDYTHRSGAKVLTVSKAYEYLIGQKQGVC